MRIISALLFFIFAVSVFAGDFEDMKNDIREFKSTISSSDGMRFGSRRLSDLNERLVRFREVSERVQSRIEAGKTGSDFAFGKYAALIQSAAKSGTLSRGKDSSKNSVMHQTEIPPGRVIDLMERDAKALDLIGFQSDGSFREEARPWLSWLEYQRLFDYFRASSGQLSTLMKDGPWRLFFFQRLKRMKDLSSELQKDLARRDAALARKINLPLETAILCDYCVSAAPKDFFLSVDLGNEGLPGKGNVSKKEDAALAVKRIQTLFKELLPSFRDKKEPSAPEVEEPAAVPLEKTSKPSLPEKNAPSPEKKAESIPFERMKEPELAAALEKLRDRCFPAPGAEALAPGQLDKCMATLTPAQKTQYESIAARRVRNGESEPEAAKNALVDLRPLLNTKNFAPTRKESVDILKNNSESSKP